MNETLSINNIVRIIGIMDLNLSSKILFLKTFSSSRFAKSLKH